MDQSVKKSWSVVITCDHEWDQTFGGAKGIAITEMTVSRIVDGDDEVCDALWAAGEAVKHLRGMYNIPGEQTIHVSKIDIRECE